MSTYDKTPLATVLNLCVMNMPRYLINTAWSKKMIHNPQDVSDTKNHTWCIKGYKNISKKCSQKYLCENSSENSDTKVYSRSFAKIKSISKFIQTLVLRYEVSIRVLHCLEPTAWEDEAVYDKIGHL